MNLVIRITRPRVSRGHLSSDTSERPSCRARAPTRRPSGRPARRLSLSGNVGLRSGCRSCVAWAPTVARSAGGVIPGSLMSHTAADGASSGLALDGRATS